ncbi:MAG: hypothetical protein JXR37_08365 [Kiritimatiellae bacterium]|nr:hypothetical protein [Kiritimatiellia bacterium]
MTIGVDTLAKRLGMAVHVSPLRFRLRALRDRFPSRTAKVLEDWLIDEANARGARVVSRANREGDGFVAPPIETLSNEELVVGLCQIQCIDRPQILRLAAQLISRRAVDCARLCLAAERERVGRILAELAKQALRVEPDHDLWRDLQAGLGNQAPLRDSLLHWTRLAEPVLKDGRVNAAAWRLVA